MLHSMLQYHVFSDSLDLAKLLIYIGRKESSDELSDDSKKSKPYYEPAFQLGLDMLVRLK